MPSSPIPRVSRRYLPRDVRKTIKRPSGERLASKSNPAPERVTRRRPLPFAFITQMSPLRVLYATTPRTADRSAAGIGPVGCTGTPAAPGPPPDELGQAAATAIATTPDVDAKQIETRMYSSR